MPVEGGERIQITRKGGLDPLVSPDGKSIYYLKGTDEGGSLWTVPVEGGEERQVLSSVFAVNYDVIRHGHFISTGLFRTLLHSVFQIRNRQDPPACPSREAYDVGFSVSRDEGWILYPHVDYEGSDVMLVENFR